MKEENKQVRMQGMTQGREDERKEGRKKERKKKRCQKGGRTKGGSRLVWKKKVLKTKGKVNL